MATSGWWLTVLFLAFIVLYPGLTLLINSFKTDHGYSLQNYTTILTDGNTVKSMVNSFKVVVPSTIIATITGVFLAWAVVRTDLPGKKYWEMLLSIPYFIPPFIGAIAWSLLLGPVGYFNRLAMELLGLQQPLFNVYSIEGMIFVMSTYRYAISFLVVMPAMKKISASSEEAARISGASTWRTLKDITLPLVAPSIVGATLLTFMYMLADFGVSTVLGAPNQIRLMTTQIYHLVNRPDMPNNLQLASAYSMLLSLIGLVGLVIYNRVLKKDKYIVVTGKSTPAEPTKLGGFRWLLFLAIFVIFLFTTCAPIMATFATSVTKVWGLPLDFGNLTFENFSNLLKIKNITRAFANSFFLSVASGVVITFVTLIIAYIVIRGGVKGVRGVRLMQILVTLPYSIPGTIIALAMILSFAQPLPLVGWKLYGTIWILLVAYIARFMNLGYNNISGAVSQIDPSLEEAARISGASHIASFKDIMIPLLSPSLLNSFFLVLAPTLSEIALSSLLWSVGNETIGTVVFSAQEEGKILRTASLAIVLIITIIFINIIIKAISNRTGKNKQLSFVKENYGKIIN